MPRRAVRILAIAVAAAVMAWAAWAAWRTFGGEERAIRNRLDGLRDDVNAGAAEGLESIARAAAIGSHFTDDVVVDLGQGAAPIAGRETLMGMAARLQPRTAAFRLEFQDVGVTLGSDAATADVNLTATFARRSVTTGEESLDAREFSAVMSKAGGTWRIARLTAVDTLR